MKQSYKETRAAQKISQEVIVVQQLTVNINIEGYYWLYWRWRITVAPFLVSSDSKGQWSSFATFIYRFIDSLKWTCWDLELGDVSYSRAPVKPWVGSWQLTDKLLSQAWDLQTRNHGGYSGWTFGRPMRSCLRACYSRADSMKRAEQLKASMQSTFSVQLLYLTFLANCTVHGLNWIAKVLLKRWFFATFQWSRIWQVSWLEFINLKSF